MNIKRKESPSFTQGRQGKSIDGFIIHWIVGNLASADATFANRARNTSAHYGVEDDNVHQYVDDANTAYHAGDWNVNLTTIGIEHSAQPGRAASDKTYESSAQLIAQKIREGKGKNYLRSHSVIVATQCSGTVDPVRIANRVNEILDSNVAKPVVIQPTQPKSEPAPPSIGAVTVTVPVLNVRTGPTSQSAQARNSTIPDGTLKQGEAIQITGIVQGENVSGVSTWLRTLRGNYVWAGGTDYPTTPAVKAAGGVAEAIRLCYVRTAPSVNAPVGGSQILYPGDRFEYSAKVYGDYVSGNNVWYHSTRGNYVWSGNVKDV